MSEEVFVAAEKLKEVARRIRAVREDVGIAADDMAARTGVSVEEYRRIEAGETDFGFTFVYKFANVCGIEMTDIMEGNSPILTNYTVTRKGDGLHFTRMEGYTYHHLAPLFKHKIAEPFYVEIPYSAEALMSPAHLCVHKGQEFDVVVKGTVKIQIGDHHEILREGDSVYYDSSTPHDLVAMNGEDAAIYAVVMNPSSDDFGQVEKAVSMPSVTNVEKANLKDPVYARFIDETVTDGHLESIAFKNTEHFNFAFDVVDALADKCPQKTAMLHVSADKVARTFTFADMREQSAKTANYFRSLGIKKGDRVMLVLRRNYQFWFSILALHKLGAVAIPATDLLTEHDFTYRFNAAGVSAVVCSGDSAVSEQVDLAAEQCPSLRVKILTNGSRSGWHDFDAEMPAFSADFKRTDDTAGGKDPLIMFFTSGTTGYPKIAVHNHLYPLGHFITAKYWHNVDPNGLHFTIADTGWGKALWGKLYGQWLCEAATFTYDFTKFDAADVLPMLSKYNVTTFCAPPTIYRFFIKENLQAYDLTSVKHATVAGEALNPEVFNQFLKGTGVPLMEGFGQTETTLTVGNFVGQPMKPGSMGKPSPLYDVDILLPDGTPAKVGEVGEIVVHTENGAPCGLFAGYYGDEESTREAWHDGCYHTGDTAWRDQDGFFFYVGRVDDLIKSSGYRIGPFEIESVIMQLPYVLECAVTAAPDEIRGQVVKATIVLTKDRLPSEELKKEIQTYVKKHTAPYKYPRIVEFRDELPKTISGKIRRVELREE